MMKENQEKCKVTIKRENSQFTNTVPIKQNKQAGANVERNGKLRDLE